MLLKSRICSLLFVEASLTLLQYFLHGCCAPKHLSNAGQTVL
jgi:hypothetical protein